MRNLMTYAVQCMKMLDEINIPYVTPIDWQVNTRAKRWGYCKRVPCGNEPEFLIQINASLLDERNDEVGLMNTIIHELLHTCPGCFNHSASWQYMAQRVYNAFGYRIQRTSSAKEKGVEIDLRSERIDTHRYAVSCPKCGWVRYYERAGKHVQRPERYRCNACMTTIVRTK